MKRLSHNLRDPSLQPGCMFTASSYSLTCCLSVSYSCSLVFAAEFCIPLSVQTTGSLFALTFMCTVVSINWQSCGVVQQISLLLVGGLPYWNPNEPNEWVDAVGGCGPCIRLQQKRASSVCLRVHCWCCSNGGLGTHRRESPLSLQLFSASPRE